MYRCSVLWHKYGHAYNEMTNTPNTEQNAHQFEIKMIDLASTTNCFRNLGVSVSEILEYLQSRNEQYAIGITDSLTKNLSSLCAKLNSLLVHGFMS
jgi:hypothetical protein